MKLFYIVSLIFVLFFGCSAKKPPLRDISNAKMALVKADNDKVKKYEAMKLINLQKKFSALKELMNQKRYEEAKFLSQEIQADARVLEKKVALKEANEAIKSKNGEINLINKNFTQIKEGE
jgi:hypothetical protein